MVPRQILLGPLPGPSEEIGDAAIVLGAVRLLRQRFPDARIVGWYSRGQAWGTRAVEALMSAYEVDAIILSPTWPAPAGAGALGIVAHRASAAARSLGTTSLARICRKRVAGLPLGRLGDLVRSICASDLVICRGGGHLGSTSLWGDMWMRLWVLGEVSIARAAGVPYALWGHSIQSLEGPLGKSVLFPIVRDSAVTVCREQMSNDYLLSLGAPAQMLAVLPDTAFGVRAAPEARVQEVLRSEGLQDLGAPMIGINVRGAVSPANPYYQCVPRVLEAAARAAEHMHRTCGIHAVMVPHRFATELFPVPSAGDDREAARRVAALLGNPPWMHVLEGDYSVEELVGLYAQMDMTIVARLHAGILAAVAGTPSILLSYQGNKFYGTARALDLLDYVLDVEELTPETLAAKAEGLWRNRMDVTRRVRGRMVGVRDQLGRYVDLTLAGIDAPIVASASGR